MIHKATQQVTVEGYGFGTQYVFVDGVRVEGDAVVEFKGGQLDVRDGKLHSVTMFNEPSPLIVTDAEYLTEMRLAQSVMRAMHG